LPDAVAIQPARLASRSRVIATAAIRSLKEPVGLAASTLNRRFARPSEAAGRSPRTSGVRPSPSVTARAASCIGSSGA